MTDFGWDYPAGTPGPRPAELEFRCLRCDVTYAIEAEIDLGAIEALESTDCPACGGREVEQID